MDYKYLNDQGSFKAWGIGFHYDYDSEYRILDIVNARSTRPALCLDVDDSVSKAALEFVTILNKSVQITALVYSNNSSIDLSDILAPQTLKPILGNAALRAKQAYFLDSARYSAFLKDYNYCNENCSLEITHSPETAYTPPTYHLHFKAYDGAFVSSRHTLLHKAFLNLSQVIVDDIIMRDFLQAPQDQIHSLLNEVNALHMLGYLLQPDFFPHHFVRKNSAHRAGTFGTV